MSDVVRVTRKALRTRVAGDPAWGEWHMLGPEYQSREDIQPVALGRFELRAVCDHVIVLEIGVEQETSDEIVAPAGYRVPEFAPGLRCPRCFA